jgi:hypothetical protein
MAGKVNIRFRLNTGNDCGEPRSHPTCALDLFTLTRAIARVLCPVSSGLGPRVYLGVRSLTVSASHQPSGVPVPLGY